MDSNICEYCGNEHDGTYGSGRFCSARCSRKYSNTYVSEEGRQKQINSLLSKKNRDKQIKNKKEKSKKYIKIHRKFRDKQDFVGDENNTLRIGMIGELAVTKKFIDANVDVYKPIVDTGIDLIANFDNKLQKIQIKSSSYLSGVDNSSTIFTLSTSHTGKNKVSKRNYSEDEIDYFALYDLNEDETFLIKNTGKKSATIKYNSKYSSQTKNIIKAEDHQIDTVLNKLKKS